jgi:hypothetical protein
VNSYDGTTRILELEAEGRVVSSAHSTCYIVVGVEYLRLGHPVACFSHHLDEEITGEYFIERVRVC